MRTFDTLEPDPSIDGRLIKTAVAPRPIAWISSVSEDGIDNLAPFSSYNYVSPSPPVLVFNTGIDDDDQLKDTPRNAIDTEEFVVNVVTEKLAKQMDQTSAKLPPEESEFDNVDIERASSLKVTPPRVADAILSMECTLYDSKRVYDRMMVFGEVVCYHVAEEILTNGKIDVHRIGTIGRLGGPYYTPSDPTPVDRL